MTNRIDIPYELTVATAARAHAELQADAEARRRERLKIPGGVPQVGASIPMADGGWERRWKLRDQIDHHNRHNGAYRGMSTKKQGQGIVKID